MMQLFKIELFLEQPLFHKFPFLFEYGLVPRSYKAQRTEVSQNISSAS